MPDPLPSTIAFLPLDLHRWDRGPGGDALVVPVWSDIRPLRGATGLLDWRLCGRLSQLVRDGRVTGIAREKLLLVTSRVPWKRVLAIGLGDSSAFDSESFRVAVDCSLAALRGIGAATFAIALPGRDIDCIRPDKAVSEFLGALDQDEQARGSWVERVTIIDSAPAFRTGSGLVRHAMPIVHPANRANSS